MRILYVVQRYGPDVAGGAELHCRRFATLLARRGHDVAVLTSCAESHTDWTNVYPAGETTDEGVRVRRLPVTQLSRGPGSGRAFERLDNRISRTDPFLPIAFGQHWMEQRGPYLPDLPGALNEEASNSDVAVFFTYLFWPTWKGLQIAAPVVPTVLHPTAHDEPALYLKLYDTTFRHPAAFAFSTEEEAALVRRRFPTSRPWSVIGVGTDLDFESPRAGATFRSRFALEDRPYLLYVGRVEDGKGARELFEFFTTYKARNPGPLTLVFLGRVVSTVGEHPDVFCTGFVDDDLRADALAGCLALAQPSFFESFSMVLTEAWAAGRPALVQGHCDVLVGQARRSGGAVPYRGYAEFEAAVDLLVADPAMADALGRAGRRYVETNYGWDTVLDRYEALLERVAARAPVPGDGEGRSVRSPGAHPRRHP